MVVAGDGVLDVAQHGVDPVEGGNLRAGTATAGDVALMGVGRGIEGPETSQAIADHLTAGGDGGLGIAAQLGAGEAAHAAQLDALRMAVVIGLHRGDERELVLGAASALSRPFAAQVGIIDLDAAGERLPLVTLVHDLQQLVLELPGGVVADAELPGQLQRRETILALGQQIDGQEPGGERQMRGMEDGAGGERGLMMTAMALVKPTRELAAGGVATVGAHEPLGPAMLEEGCLALRFRAVLLEKRR